MLAYSELTLVISLNVIALSLGQKPIQKNPATIDAPTLENKDVLLQMLEKKLKEIKDNKKLKTGNGDILPKNVDFNLRSNGISAVGDAELLLRYGKNGQGMVNLTADGISNVGKVQVVVGSGNNGLHIPGLANLFVAAASIRSEDRNDQNQLQLVNPDDIAFGFRRQTNVSSATNTSDKVNINNPATDVVEVKKDEAKVETTSSIAVGNTNGANIVSAAIGDTSSSVNVVNVNAAVTSGPIVAASNSPVSSPGRAIKSDTVPVNAVAGNGDNVNSVK